MICYYINGEKEGECKSYHENGQLCTIYNYVKDMREGEYKQYNENGQLC